MQRNITVDEKTRKDLWDPASAEIAKEVMDLRIKAAVSQRGWQEVIRIFEKRGVPVSALKVAEVGSGSGTLALTFGLMGASVTLIDFNEKALARSRKIYAMYSCEARFMKKDCTEDPPPELINTFDIVMSLGLMEHFSGNNRKRVMEYHRLLMKEGGIVFLLVPNRRNLFYWLIRGIRRLSGTWTIDVEIPFSSSELMKAAREAGFSDPCVIGYADLWRDIADNIDGLGYALLDCLPKKWITFLRGWNARIKIGQHFRAQATVEMVAYCRQIAKSAEVQASAGAISKVTDQYCSMLTLIALK